MFDATRARTAGTRVRERRVETPEADGPPAAPSSGEARDQWSCEPLYRGTDKYRAVAPLFPLDALP